MFCALISLFFNSFLLDFAFGQKIWCVLGNKTKEIKILILPLAICLALEEGQEREGKQ